MTVPVRVCPSCETRLPAEAGFCPGCGEPTPTQIGDEGSPTRVKTGEADERESRERLQRALGSGYELRELIGRGGFGAVYGAWDVKLERAVAVKALRHDLFPTSAILERFEREAKAVAKLRHPNILPILFVGEGEGITFMVMPKIDGETYEGELGRNVLSGIHAAVRQVASDIAVCCHGRQERKRSSLASLCHDLCDARPRLPLDDDEAQGIRLEIRPRFGWQRQRLRPAGVPHYPYA